MSLGIVRRTVMTAAVIGVPAVGMALLAHAGFGFCDERMSADAGMGGMTMSDAPGAAGVCPILVVGVALAFALAVLAILTAWADRPAAAAHARDLARTLTRRGLVGTAALLAIAAISPLAAVAAQHGTVVLSAPGAGVLLGALIGGAVAGAIALRILAGIVLACAVRLVRAVFRALVLCARGRAIAVARPPRRLRAPRRFGTRPDGPRAPPFLAAAA